MNTTTRRSVAAGMLALTLVGGASGAAQAKGGDDDARVRASGSCSEASTWKLKAKPDDGRLEVELEVDSNRTGQRWAVRITDRGHRVFTGHRVTRGPSGSFEVEKKIRNRRGVDRIRAVAVHPRTGERCVARVAYRG